MRSVTPAADAGGRGGDRSAVLTSLVRVCTDLGLRFSAPAARRFDLDGDAHRDLGPGGDVALGVVLDGLGRTVHLRIVDYPTFWAAVAVRAAEDAEAARLLAALPPPRMAPPLRLGDLVVVDRTRSPFPRV
jgi:hypothetical protein